LTGGSSRGAFSVNLVAVAAVADAQEVRYDTYMKGSGPVAWLVYIAVRVVFAVMQVFPVNWNLRTARILAGVWARIMPRHRQRAVAHLQQAFGDRYSLIQIQHMADRCLESVTMFAVEAICLPRLINAFTWGRYIQPVNFDEALRVFLDGRGAVLVTGHYGSFEVMGHLLAALGFDTVAVMRPLDNAHLNNFIVSSRRTHGLTLLDKKGAAAEAEQRLRDGSLVGFIGDQDAGRKGMFVDFFGRPASTYKSIGLLAMTANVPIIVGYARRCGLVAQYDVGVQRIIHPHEWEHRDDPLRWITQEYTSAIETFVREAPEQYLWIHRRWKSQPKHLKRL
jgi:KDO2-lipid IV(A) lauroyltransferase